MTTRETFGFMKKLFIDTLIRDVSLSYKKEMRKIEYVL